jgi:hypothetical protein
MPTVHIPPSGLAERGVRIFALESGDPAHRVERDVLRDAFGVASAKVLEPDTRAIAAGILGSLDWHQPRGDTLNGARAPWLKGADLAGSGTPVAGSSQTAVTNVRVFDGDRIGEPTTIVIDGGVIAPGGRGDVEVDGAGGFLLPGLIDTHVHLHELANLERPADFGVTRCSWIVPYPMSSSSASPRGPARSSQVIQRTPQSSSDR